jgi:hypothetical protein
MNGMADDSLALNVAEATIEEWMAAVAQASLAPIAAVTERRPAPSHLPHPVPVRPIVRCSPRRPVQAEPPAEVSSVADARSVYWIVLAAALAWAVLL